MGLLIISIIGLVLSVILVWMAGKRRRALGVLFGILVFVASLASLVNLSNDPSSGEYYVIGAYSDGVSSSSYRLQIKNPESNSTEIVRDVTVGSIPGLDLMRCVKNRDECGCVLVEKSFWKAQIMVKAIPCTCKIPVD